MSEIINRNINLPHGTKILIVCPTPQDFNAFRRIQPELAKHMFLARNAADLAAHPKSDVMCVGAFWAHPEWDAMFRVLVMRCTGKTAVKVNWFPSINI